MSDRKTDNFVTQIKTNAKDIEDFKFTQFSGADSIKTRLYTNPYAYDSTVVANPNERWTFYAQTLDYTSYGPSDANYSSGLMKVWIDGPPGTVPQYTGLKSTSMSSGLGVLCVGVNQIEFQNGHFWAIQLTNIDTVPHSIYVKSYINTTQYNPITSWGYQLT